MKQVVQNYRSGELSVREVAAPRVSAGGLLVRNECSLISAGTEKSTVRVAQKSLAGKALERPDMVRKVLRLARTKGVVETARVVLSRLETPAALGYSCAGTVVGVGRDVTGFRVGDRVACAGQNYASHAEWVFVPKNLCVPIPEGVSAEDACYVALGAIALQGVRRAEAQLGERVVVLGLGLLGQLTVQLLAANGCTVIGADVDASKLELARQHGARLAVALSDLPGAVAAASGGQGADAVIITASTKDDGPVELAGEISRKRGRVVIVGAVGLRVPREPYYVKELDLRVSTSYGPGRYDPVYEEGGHDYPFGYVRWTEQRNMEAFLDLVRDARVSARVLTTHRFPIERAGEAYALIMQGQEPYLGIALSYGGTTEAPAEPPRTMRVTAPGRAEGAVRIGLIGAGSHVKDSLLPALGRQPGVELRAVCTGTGVNAEALARKLGAPLHTTDYEAVLGDDRVNAVLIGTRHNSHGNLVVKALEAGKHVFVEKPLCLSEEELRQVSAAYGRAARAGQRLLVGFNRRFSPHATRLREHFAGRGNPLVMSYRVNAGAIPPGHWTQDAKIGGGRIIGEGCHFVDLMQHVCGALTATVGAVSIGGSDSGITNDQSILSLEFTDGSVGTLVYAAGGDPALAKERLEVLGDSRAAVLDDYLRTELYRRGRRQVVKTRAQDKGFAAEMALFCQGVLSPDVEFPAFAEIEAVTRACLLAEDSLVTGERYPVGEPGPEDAPPAGSSGE